MKNIAYLIPGFLALGLMAFAPSALALSTTLESEGTVTVQSPVNDDDMIYVGPGDDTPATDTELAASVTSGPAPLSVTFTGLGLNAEAEYIIDFGDGTNSGPLTASGRCPQTTYPASPDCIGVSATHTYRADGTYTATLQPYAACMWSNPRCLMAAMLLGEVTIVVGNGQNAQEPVNEDGMTYEGGSDVPVAEEGSDGQAGFFSTMWNGVVTFFVGNESGTNTDANVATDGSVTGANDESAAVSGELSVEAGVRNEPQGFFTGIWRSFLSFF